MFHRVLLRKRQEQSLASSKEVGVVGNGIGFCRGVNDREHLGEVLAEQRIEED